MGKLGVATSTTRPPRLVVDSSVCGLNQNCPLPENGSLPSAKDLIRSFPLRSSSCTLAGLSLDIKSAHKRVAIHPSEHGLVGFAWQDKIYFYKVCPFGATFSAHWWSRLGGFLLRIIHRLLYLPHCALLYVDDFIIVQEAKVLPLSAVFLVLFCRAIHLPMSWKKNELSHTITWIGWKFNFHSGLVAVHPDKQKKLLDLISSLLKHNRVPLKIIQKVVGLAMWITQLFPLMRIWLHHLYMDMHKIPATQFSVDPGYWHEMVACLNADLTFHSRPPGTAIPVGGKLVEVRHRKVVTLDDVRSSLLSERRVCLRIRDPTSTRRFLGPGSLRTLFFADWMTHMSPIRTIWPATPCDFFAAADACAHDQMAQIGGFIQMADKTVWFSERFSPEDFYQPDVEVNHNMQRDIVCYETLAQIAIVKLLTQHLPAQRLAIRISSLSDNTGAEAGINSLFTTKLPLAFFLEKLCITATATGIQLDVSHISGKSNVLADAISRWRFDTDPPTGVTLEHRSRISSRELWLGRSSAAVFPRHTSLSWLLPK